MRIRTRILAGTALAAVLAGSQAATAATGGPVTDENAAPIASVLPESMPALLLLAQVDPEETEEERLLRLAREAAERAAKEAEEAEESEDEAAPATADEPAVEPEPEAEIEAPAEPEPEPAPEPAVEPEPEAEIEAPAEPEPEPEVETPAEPEPEVEAPADEPSEPDEPATIEEPVVEPEVETLSEPEPEVEAPTEEPSALDAPATDEPAILEEPVTPPVEEDTQAPLEEEDAAAPAEMPAETVEDLAPLLDSEKEGEIYEDDGETTAAPAEPAAPPPATDEEAQQDAQPVEVQSVREEEGQRVERRVERRERRDGEQVVQEIGDRIVIQFGTQIIVQGDDRTRMGYDATEVYYEELPRGRTRETIVRPNGVMVVTVRDRYGDIIRRSRITPDGREYVLVYADDRDRDRTQWRDPGRDLPPLRLTMSRDEYILEARRAPDADAYYAFFEQPPVERVQRLYSIDEVRYSSRVRDSMRRVDLDTVTFEFGSASIPDSEIGRLEAMAEAMLRLIDENPAETFLIEGHTDAVGSDLANLALSDRRAESVAMALTAVFGVPPENMVTQGYGKRYLKVDTQEPERLNRRVAMRRITPLVAPIASR